MRNNRSRIARIINLILLFQDLLICCSVVSVFLDLLEDCSFGVIESVSEGIGSCKRGLVDGILSQTEIDLRQKIGNKRVELCCLVFVLLMLGS